MDHLTRRQCLASLGAVATSPLMAGWGAGELSGHDEVDEDLDVDSRARAIVERTFVFDGNVQPYVGESGVYPTQRFEIAKLTGIHAGFRTVRVETIDHYREPRTCLTVRTASDLEEARRTGRHGCVLYVQGHVSFEGSTEKLLNLKRRGFRALQLAYDGESELGGGADRDDIPLSRLGRAVIMALETEQMVADVSHCGSRTTLDACSVSTKPVLANHANVSSVCEHPRNKSDEEVRAIAETDGVIGIMRIPWAVHDDRQRTITVADFVAHIDHVVQLVGPRHVGIATDGYASGGELRRVDAHLASPRRWTFVASALLARGYGQEDVERILGGNFLRVLRHRLAAA